MADRSPPSPRGDPGDLNAEPSRSRPVVEEMVSGPDLGGGYLHQLTVSPAPPRTRFTYHAQAGGADASGPPLGPLDPFGFAHPPTPCPFGGPRCWHRVFEAAPEAAVRVRQAYNRMRFVLATLLEQQYSGRAAAVEAALLEIVSRVGESTEAPGRWWYVGGSTAAWLLGASIVPQDIDLGTDEAGVEHLALALQDYLIEPLATTEWGAAQPVFAARAFVGTMRDGARTEWAKDRGTPARGGRFYEWSGDPERVRWRTIEFHGKRVVVTRPEYALVRALEKGKPERAEAVRVALRSLGPDRELLLDLLDHSSLSEPEKDSERRSLFGTFPVEG